MSTRACASHCRSSGLPRAGDCHNIGGKPDADLGTEAQPDADLGTEPKPQVDGSSNNVFNLPKPKKPVAGSATTPKLPKLDKPLVPRVTDLLPRLRGAQNAAVGHYRQD